MKVRIEIEIEPGESPNTVAMAVEAWLERTAPDGITNGERLVERLVRHGVNVSEEHPEVEVTVVS
jgi:hypothetical protein